MDKQANSSVACGGKSGSIAPNWIQAGHNYTFGLYAGSTTQNLLASVLVTGKSAGMPWINSSSNPVVIPYGQSSANYTLSWSAPGYSTVTIYGANNQYQNGAILCLGNVPASGSAVEGEDWGEVADLYLVPNQSCVAGTSVSSVPTPVLDHLHLTSQQGTPPSLTASQNPVVIPAGQTSAPYTLSWNAPGYGTVSLYGEQNQFMPGQIVCLGSVSDSGSAGESMSAGEVATLYMGTDQNCSPGSVVSSVPGLLATLNITTR
jgi:hypothetical protein